MRRVLYREGIKDLGIVIEKGAMNWNESLPIVWQFSTDIADLLGKAHSLRREDNGDVTARLDLEDNERGRWAAEILQQGDGACSIWANALKEKRVTVGKGKNKFEQRVITTGTIRQVAVVLSNAVPWSLSRK